MALRSTSRNLPVDAGASFAVCHRTRSDPLSKANDSVCVLPWPDHDPSVRHPTTWRSRVCEGGSGAHEALNAIAATRAIVLIIHDSRFLIHDWERSVANQESRIKNQESRIKNQESRMPRCSPSADP